MMLSAFGQWHDVIDMSMPQWNSFTTQIALDGFVLSGPSIKFSDLCPFFVSEGD